MEGRDVPLSKSEAIRRDPTRTAGLRRAFMADVNRRFREAFIALVAKVSSTLGTQFTYRRADEKLEQFQEWFRGQIREKILVVEDPLKETPWLAKYVRSAYREALVKSHIEVRKAQGIRAVAPATEEFLLQAFASPEAVSKIKMMAARSFTDMKGVTEDMDARMTRVLTDGIAHGRSVRKVAKELNEKVVGLGKMKAMLVARNEIIRVHAEGQLDAFEQLDVGEVTLNAEMLTAWNACPRCTSIASGGPFSLSEARGMLPIHPRCRCAWGPHIAEFAKYDRRRSRV
jgi:SPP1 gp7 family putative phage head morphogenesis protein